MVTVRVGSAPAVTATHVAGAQTGLTEGTPCKRRQLTAMSIGRGVGIPGERGHHRHREDRGAQHRAATDRSLRHGLLCLGLIGRVGIWACAHNSSGGVITTVPPIYGKTSAAMFHLRPVIPAPAIRTNTMSINNLAAISRSFGPARMARNRSQVRPRHHRCCTGATLPAARTSPWGLRPPLGWSSRNRAAASPTRTSWR